MNKIYALLLTGLVAVPTFAIGQSVEGTWRTEPTAEGALEIQIAPCGTNMCGVIAAARSLSGEAGDYPHLGRRMIWDMAPDGASNWAKGKIWDPRNGKTYTSKMELNGNTLTVSGCVLGFCQGQTWQRVN